MASETKKIILTLVFLLITPPSLGEKWSYRTCFLMCIDVQCPPTFVNLACLQGCHKFCIKGGGMGATMNTVGGRPMLANTTGGSSESNEKPQMTKSTEGSNSKESNSPPMMTNSTEGLMKSHEQAVNSTASERPMVESTMDQQTSMMDPMEELRKSNGWPMMGDSMQGAKDSSIEEQPLSHSMEEEDTEMPRVTNTNSMEGLGEYNALPMLIGRLGGN